MSEKYISTSVVAAETVAVDGSALVIEGFLCQTLSKLYVNVSTLCPQNIEEGQYICF